MPKLPRLGSLRAQAKRDGWLEYVRTENDERALLDGMRVDLRAIDRVEKFGARLLRFWEGPAAGRPFVLAEWQRRDLFGPLFGWKKWSPFYRRWVRRFDRVYCEVPKKNGKSPTAAFVGLYLLTADGEPGAKIYSAATTREQAGIVHGHAVHMAEASPRLQDLLKINRTNSTIWFPAANGYYRAISKLADAAQGLNANGIICDELHEWKRRALWDALKWATASRAQPILFAITTAGESTDTVCYEQHSYAQSVRAGEIIDAGFLGLIYAADPTDDDSSPKVWRKANPSLGVTIDPERYAADYAEASKLATTLAAFRRLRLNIWGQAAQAWLTRDAWSRCEAAFTPADLAGQTCWLSIDLAPVKDMTAIAATFPFEAPPVDAPNGPPILQTKNLVWCFLPEATAIEYRKQIPIDEWVARGELTLVPGDVTDFEFIKAKMAELHALFDCRELAFDPYVAEQLTQDIVRDLGLPRAEYRQTWANFSEPMSTMERWVLARRFWHNGNRLLRWQAAHVNFKLDASGNPRPVKPPAGDIKKIDGIVALIMSHGRAIRNVAGEWPDVDEYEIPMA